MKTNTKHLLSSTNEMREYWKTKLHGEIESINIDIDFELSSDFHREVMDIKFTKDLTKRIMKLGKNEKIVVYTILVSGIKVLLAKYTQQKDIITICPQYDGSEREDDNYVVLRDNVSLEMTFKELLMCVRRTIIDGYKNQKINPMNILEEMGVNSEAVMKVAISMEDIHNDKQIYNITNSSSNYFTFSFSMDEQDLKGNINYNSSIFSKDTIERISKLFIHIMKAVLDNMEMKLFDLDLILEEEKNKILYTFNNEANYCIDKTIHELFEEQVKNSKDSIAIESDEKTLTYGELNLRSNQLAITIREKISRKNSIIGIMVNRSIDMGIGILGILKSGNAYLPIDSEYPEDRVNYMLKECGVNVIVTQKGLVEKIKYKADIILIDDEKKCTSSIPNVENINNPSDLAYVIYTSGSTGKPKGILIEHRNILNYVFWRNKTLKYCSEDVTLQLISYSFDGFGSNFYSSILSGGKLIIPKNKVCREFDFIKELIDERGVTKMAVVPSMYRSILENAKNGDLRSLKIVTLAGEKSDPELIERSNMINPDIMLVNEYGPTENSVATTAYFGMTPSSTAIIGKPIYNNKVYILDKYLNFMPIGIRGEIFVSGSGLSRGYLKNPELTRKKFIKNPYFKDELIYSTGDIGKWLPDGNIEYLGRTDEQIKIKGFRVEIGEIESTLYKYKQIKEVVVISNKDFNNNNYLCAYVTSDIKLDVNQLKEYLLGQIPEYMVPAFFMQLNKLPKTPNGKVDKNSIPLPNQSNIIKQDYVPPKNDLEKTMQRIWSNILGIDEIGINDDFFVLGGDSLKAIKVVSGMKKEAKIDIYDVYKYSTINKLANNIISKK